MILHMVAFLPCNRQKTDPRPQVVRKNYRSRPVRRITHPTRSDTSMQPYTTPLHARNLARTDCTCKSRNEICHFVTILIGKRLSVLSVRGSTFHPAEGNSKAGKPTNCNVKLWFVLDTCCTSSLSSTQLHIETQKELLLRPSSTTLLIFSSRSYSGYKTFHRHAVLPGQSSDVARDKEQHEAFDRMD